MLATFSASSFGIGDLRAVHRLDHVAGLQARLRRRAVRLNAGQQRAAVLLQMHRLRGARRDLLRLDADIAAHDLAVLLQLRGHGADHVGRDGEADADRTAGRRQDRGVHADDLAVLGEQRAAGVALVDRRIDLDELIIRAGADVAADGRDDARGDRAARGRTGCPSRRPTRPASRRASCRAG